MGPHALGWPSPQENPHVQEPPLQQTTSMTVSQCGHGNNHYFFGQKVILNMI